jgi:hypothetical protein
MMSVSVGTILALRRWIEVVAVGHFVYAKRAVFTETYITSLHGVWGVEDASLGCCADAASISSISEVIILLVSCLHP